MSDGAEMIVFLRNNCEIMVLLVLNRIRLDNSFARIFVVLNLASWKMKLLRLPAAMIWANGSFFEPSKIMGKNDGYKINKALNFIAIKIKLN